MWIIGCVQNDSVEKSKLKYYKMRMKIDNMGKISHGFAVLENKPLYTIEFTSLGKMDYFGFNSCATSISRVNAGGRIFKRKSTKVNYRPNEIEKFCDIKVDTVSIKGAKYTGGFIIVRDPQFKLEAVLVCGATTNVHDGVSACQNSEGNKIRVKFQEPVKMYSVSCIVTPGEKKEFTFGAELGFCNYIFHGQISNFNHRLVTMGYNDDLLI